MATRVKRYTVRYERDESGWWIGSVPTVRGCRTQGRTIEETRRRIREALGLFVKDAARAELIDDVALPAEVRSALAAVRTTRQQLERTQAEAAARMTQALRLLRARLKVSLKDAGTLLGVSRQRVHQLSEEARA